MALMAPALLASAVSAAPAGVTLKASVDSTVVVMGDITSLRLQAILPTTFIDSARVADMTSTDCR